MNLTYIRFCEFPRKVCLLFFLGCSLAWDLDQGLKRQGIDRKKFIYSNPFQPYLSYWGLLWTVIFILINGFYVFWEFNASSFLTCCAYFPKSGGSLTDLTKFRHQYSFLRSPVLWVQNFQEDESMEDR